MSKASCAHCGQLLSPSEEASGLRVQLESSEAENSLLRRQVENLKLTLEESAEFGGQWLV